MFVNATPPSATASASSPAYARKLSADHTCTDDCSRFQHMVTNSTTNGSDITCGCRSPRMKLKNGNSWIV